MKTLFEAVKEKNIPYDTHESDLYLPDTKEVHLLLAEYYTEFLSNIRRFKNQLNGEIWLDVPFENSEWWDKRTEQ
jgi:hypothetical protein